MRHGITSFRWLLNEMRVGAEEAECQRVFRKILAFFHSASIVAGKRCMRTVRPSTGSGWGPTSAASTGRGHIPPYLILSPPKDAPTFLQRRCSIAYAAAPR